MGEPSTFIKLDRQFLTWRWFKDANTARTFLYLLLRANYAASDYEKQHIRRGQLVTSYRAISNALGITERQAERAILHLRETGEIESITFRRGQLITIVNYGKYQDSQKGSRAYPHGEAQALDKSRKTGNRGEADAEAHAEAERTHNADIGVKNAYPGGEAQAIDIKGETVVCGEADAEAERTHNAKNGDHNKKNILKEYNKPQLWEEKIPAEFWGDFPDEAAWLKFRRGE